MNNFIAPEIDVFDINPMGNIQIGSGSKVTPNVPS